MNQKAELPSLTGHRTKTRKRDEKKVYDPSGFRDSVIEGLEASRDDEDLEAAADLDAISKWLDIAGNKLDYRRYGEALLEILIAGGLLAPGGSIQQDGDKGTVSTRNCIFMDGIDMAKIKQWDNVVIKLMRRYKYLEKMLSEEMKKILVYLRGFTEEHRQRLAQITAIWLCSGLVVPNVCVVVINEHQVRALEMRFHIKPVLCPDPTHVTLYSLFLTPVLACPHPVLTPAPGEGQHRAELHDRGAERGEGGEGLGFRAQPPQEVG